MGYRFNSSGLNLAFAELAKDFRLLAPRRFAGEGAFSDTDSIRYGEVFSVDEIELSEKSSHSFKEALFPASETLFFFTENSVKEADAPEKGNIVFLRSCDMHALKRLDEIYLRNGKADYYYSRLRERTRFILLGCASAFESCFCLDMGTNFSDNYDASLDKRGDEYFIDCALGDWDSVFRAHALETLDVTPAHVTQTNIRVSVPDTLPLSIAKSEMWNEYDERCIACGRCNFSCPTCTCYTMQDIFYTDNGKVGERRRVQASCMVDGFTDVAGGGCYRRKNGERMRFKVLHKVLDYKQRFGYHMCVGCGRCDDVCPEYISFSSAVNKLNDLESEV